MIFRVRSVFKVVQSYCCIFWEFVEFSFSRFCIFLVRFIFKY